MNIHSAEASSLLFVLDALVFFGLFAGLLYLGRARFLLDAKLYWLAVAFAFARGLRHLFWAFALPEAMAERPSVWVTLANASLYVSLIVSVPFVIFLGFGIRRALRERDSTSSQLAKAWALVSKYRQEVAEAVAVPAAEDKFVKILLIEDNTDDVALAQMGMDVFVKNKLDVVNDGVQALQFLRQAGAYEGADRPDLILLDLHLPRKDGHQVLKEIKADPNLSDIPVVILSGNTEELTDQERADARYVMRKPVDFDQMARIVRDIPGMGIGIVRESFN